MIHHEACRLSGNHIGECESNQDGLTVLHIGWPRCKDDDPVDHPKHYGGADNPHETIKCLKAWLSPEEYRGFCLGNAIKYISRAGDKGVESTDLDKAMWYLKEWRACLLS